MEDKHLEKNAQFIMRLGHNMKQMFLKELKTEYGHDDKAMAHMFFTFLPNFVCNVTADISIPSAIKKNLDIIIKNIEDWKNNDFKNNPGVKRTIAAYNAKEDTVEVDDIH